MIDERGLLAAVRSAWRGGGYEVVGNGQELVLDPEEGVIDEALRERLEQLPLA